MARDSVRDYWKSLACEASRWRASPTCNQRSRNQWNVNNEAQGDSFQTNVKEG